MGYFSNSTEGEAYEARWCARCVHYGESGTKCAVLEVHVLHAYGASNSTKEVLDGLIPESRVGNGKCRMFITGEDLARKRRERVATERAAKLPGVE